MLQQTQVKTVIPYFNNFIKKVTNLKQLSESSEKKILKLWEGLGYYRRAKNLRRSAKIIVKDYKSKIPKTYEEIKKLPGAGDYTASILLALIYNKPFIGIDGNVKRIFLRLFNTRLEKNNNLYKTDSTRFVIPQARNAEMAEALIEFGAIMCKPKDPQCSICNLKLQCYFFKNSNLKPKKKKIIIKKKKYNIFCYLKKKNKQIALAKNKKLSFLKGFIMPKIENIKHENNKKINGWNYLGNYKNNISNIKMKINLFYKFTNTSPKNFKWYYIEKREKEFMPSFTKKIIKDINKVFRKDFV